MKTAITPRMTVPQLVRAYETAEADVRAGPPTTTRPDEGALTDMSFGRSNKYRFHLTWVDYESDEVMEDLKPPDDSPWELVSMSAASRAAASDSGEFYEYKDTVWILWRIEK